MKFAFGVLVFLWLLAGLAAAWREDELNARHWQIVALGPISLIDSFNDNPVSLPGPN